MDDENIKLLEKYCTDFYESADAVLRTKAEQNINAFIESPSCLQQCQCVLQRSASPYVQLLAVNTLCKLLSKGTICIPVEERFPMRNYVLEVLFKCKFVPFLLQAYIQLFVRLTKLSWFDSHKGEFVFRNVREDVSPFLSGDLNQCSVVIQLFSALVSEMNTHDSSRRVSEHRRIAPSFRDSALLDIFKMCITLIQEALEKQLNGSGDHQRSTVLLPHLVKLAYNCLSFDFIGVSIDETNEEMGTVQVPSSWRDLFIDPKTLLMFFSLYRILPAHECSTVLACISQFAAVRRSLFTHDERTEYFNALVSGTKQMMDDPTNLSDANTYHEFCKLMARLKSNYQLNEFVKVRDYPAFIQLLCQLTCSSLSSEGCPSNSLHYLLSLWQRLVSSVPFLRAQEPHYLDEHAAAIACEYITSRLSSSNDEDLGDTTVLSPQLDQLATLARIAYEEVSALVINMFDRTASDYASALSSNNSQETVYKETQLTWLVYIIGALIGGRLSVSSTEDHDQLDGELICRVLRLMDGMNSRLPAKSIDKLEVSLIVFFDQFRKIYIGEQVQKSCVVYKCLSESLGLKDELVVLNIVVQKILTNLKFWADNSSILNQTLQLFNDLSTSFSGLRKLMKLDSVQYLLTHHTPQNLPFLEVTTGEDCLRYRSSFYTSLTRLLLIELGDDVYKFHEFINPLTITLDAFGQQFTNGIIYDSDMSKRMLIALCRDLRGIAFAINSKAYFSVFFEWLYPNYLDVLHRAMEMWAHDPLVSAPLLKLVCELVQNKFQRLIFDSSPIGVLLFRSCSKIICTFGERMLSLENIVPERLYAVKLKGISTCFQILKSTLAGNFVNFAILRLYNDKSFDDALHMFVKLLVSIPRESLFYYRKLCSNYYMLIDVVTANEMSLLANIDNNIMLYILSTIAEGLQSVDTHICNNSCSALDNFLYYLLRHLTQGAAIKSSLEPAPSAEFLALPQQHPALFDQMLTCLMNTVMYEECKNQWVLSRPLLGLVLLRETHFSEYRKATIASVPEDRRADTDRLFTALMEDIEPSLTSKNKDRFIQNITSFRRDVSDLLRSSKDPLLRPPAADDPMG